MDRTAMTVLVTALVALLAANVLAAPGRTRNRYSNITVDCEDLDRLDHLGREFGVIGDRDHLMPLTYDDAVNDHCPRMFMAEAVIRAYARKCFAPFTKQVIGLLIYGSSKETKARCDNDEGINKQVHYSQCTRNKDYGPVHSCMDHYILQLESIRDRVTNLDHKMPYTCCHYYEFKQCVANKLAVFCPKDSVDYVIGRMDGTTSDMLDMTCKNYEENSEGCTKLPKLTFNRKKQAKSIFPPLVDIYTNL